MKEKIETLETTCPYCGKNVSWKWDTGDKSGFISEPHNALIDDSVWHIECWNKVAEASGGKDERRK